MEDFQQQYQQEIQKKVLADYQNGVAIVDIARRYNLEVDYILDLTGNSELKTVRFMGDTIDQGEAGPNVTMNYGEVHKQTFTKN